MDEDRIDSLLLSAQLFLEEKKEQPLQKEVALSLIIFKVDSKVSTRVSFKRGSKMWLTFFIFHFHGLDVIEICDYRFQSFKLTNQSTNIEYHRVLSINRLAFSMIDSHRLVSS